MSDLTHFDSQGRAHMVDVGAKAETARVAVAAGRVRMLPATLARIRDGTAAKGGVLGVARIAAIQGAKRTDRARPRGSGVPRFVPASQPGALGASARAARPRWPDARLMRRAPA